MEKFLKRKKTITTFSLLALLGGVIFLNPSITGNAIVGEKIQHNILSFIGLLLILCSIILTIYLIRKKN